MIKEADNLVDLEPRFKILAEAKNRNKIGPGQKTKIKFQGGQKTEIIKARNKIMSSYILSGLARAIIFNISGIFIILDLRPGMPRIIFWASL